MICQACQKDFPEDDIRQLHGKDYCEDCYISKLSVPQPCDPTAVHSARKTREMLGHKGSDGLIKIQKDIYEYLQEKGKATGDELMGKFNLNPADLQKQIAILRHCELVKGTKEGNIIYFTLM